MDVSLGGANRPAGVARRGHLARPAARLARLEEVTSDLGATSAEVTEARTVRDRVLAVFELRGATGTPTTPSGFAALFEVDADQILRMAVFRDREAALDAVKNESAAADLSPAARAITRFSDGAIPDLGDGEAAWRISATGVPASAGSPEAEPRPLEDVLVKTRVAGRG